MFWMESGLSYNITLFFNGMDKAVPLFSAFSFVGGELFYILVLPLIFWCVNKSTGKRALILILVTGYISFILKNILERPLPYDVVESGKVQILNRLGLDDYGFPSTYIMGITSLWLYFFHISKKISAKILSLLVIVAAVISATVLGFSFFFSAVASSIISIIIFYLFMFIEPRITFITNNRYRVKERIFLIVFWTVAALVLLIFLRFTDFHEPVIYIAAFLGASLGAVLEKESGNFDVENTLAERVIRFCIGMIVLTSIYYLFEVLTLKWGLSNSGITFIKYALLSFIITFAMPKLFIFTNLVSVSKDS